MWIFYPPHSTSTNDKRMLQHAGSEFGYLLEGELEVTVGFDVFSLRAGDAIGFDSSTPHLLTNKSDRPARGIWFVRHPHAERRSVALLTALDQPRSLCVNVPYVVTRLPSR